MREFLREVYMGNSGEESLADEDMDAGVGGGGELLSRGQLSVFD